MVKVTRYHQSLLQSASTIGSLFTAACKKDNTGNRASLSLVGGGATLGICLRTGCMKSRRSAVGRRIRQHLFGWCIGGGSGDKRRVPGIRTEPLLLLFRVVVVRTRILSFDRRKQDLQLGRSQDMVAA